MHLWEEGKQKALTVFFGPSLVTRPDLSCEEMLQSLSCVGILQFLTDCYAIKTTVAISGPDTELNCKYKL